MTSEIKKTFEQTIKNQTGANVEIAISSATQFTMVATNKKNFAAAMNLIKAIPGISIKTVDSRKRLHIAVFNY